MADGDELEQLSNLHRYLCSLDYYTDFKDQKDSLNENLELREEDAKSSKAAMGQALPLSFDTVYDYLNEWQEVFRIESKAQIIHSGMTEKESPIEFLLKTIEVDDTFYIMTFNMKKPSPSNFRVYDFVVVAQSNVDHLHLARSTPRNSLHRNR